MKTDKNRFIVFVQEMQSPHRVEAVFGLYKSYTTACKALKQIADSETRWQDDNQYWLGIRVVVPALKGKSK